MLSSTLSLPLPIEIFLLIKGWIAHDDLRTHVCYYKTDRRIAALYDSERDADAFWARLCWMCGIGYVPTRWPLKKSPSGCSPWRDLACKVINADGFCKYPKCGEALLEYNRELVSACYAHWTTSSRSQCSHGPCDLDFLDDDEREEFRLKAHHILRQIAFPPDPIPYHHFPYDAFLRPITKKERKYDGPVDLEVHPLLAHSFATDIPVVKIELGQVAEQMLSLSTSTVDNYLGVTVDDVVDAIHYNLGAELTVADVSDHVVSHQDHFPPGWTPWDVIENMQNLRRILAICPINKWYNRGEVSESGHYFSISVK